MQYTIEQFQIDFELATTDEKSELLIKALDNLDINDPDVKEILSQYKSELKDIRDQMVIDENDFCDKAIQDGKFEVYKCIHPVEKFEMDGSYYVMIDDVAKVYEANIIPVPEFLKTYEPNVENPIIKEYISKIKPLIYIIVDNGIGTPKRRSVFPRSEFNFDNHFVKL